MGQEYSTSSAESCRTVQVVAEYDKEKSTGTWWFIGKTGTDPWDENSDEMMQEVSWNALTQKIEIKQQGYKNGIENPYTHFHKQVWIPQSSDCKSTATGALKTHYNGYWPELNSYILWMNYDQFMVWVDHDGTIYLMSRKRQISPSDYCSLSFIMKACGIPPSRMNINNKAINKDLAPMVFKEGLPRVSIARF
jgi:hypothetical protein